MNKPDHEHSIFGKMPVLRPFRKEDWKELSENAASDGHSALAPTHVLHKEGKIVGCVSIAAIPLVLPWMHSKLVTPRDSINVITVVEGVLRCGGAQNWLIPCVTNSPYFKYMESFGYVNGGLSSLFFKTNQQD